MLDDKGLNLIEHGFLFYLYCNEVYQLTAAIYCHICTQ